LLGCITKSVAKKADLENPGDKDVSKAEISWSELLNNQVRKIELSL